jgi:hypothetical protein
VRWNIQLQAIQQHITTDLAQFNQHGSRQRRDSEE